MRAAERPGVVLDDTQRLAWLRLIRSQNVGPVAFRQLINRFGSAEAAIEALPELARRGGRRAVRIATSEQAEREMAFARSRGARFIALGEPDYPRALAAADAPPPMLALLGSADALGMDGVGVVGSRNASVVGTKMCERIATELGGAGYAVVSGLARGIDAAAHRASIGTGTIACMAGGLDKPYPPENVPLMDAITEAGGAIVSEMPFGWTPRAKDFPRRNRLIAGLSLGVVVIEAAHRSGSLITARLANEMGRLVFAVPGSPLDPRAAGTNHLLKQGATIATSGADILDAIAPLAERRPFDPPELFEPSLVPLENEPDEDDRSRVIGAFGPTPVSTDDVSAHLAMPIGRLQMVLLELDLAGRLERHPGGKVSLLPESDEPSARLL